MDIETLSLEDLRSVWAEYWGVTPHKGIGPSLLRKSLDYKIREQDENGLSAEKRNQLVRLAKEYKRNPAAFEDRCQDLKLGTRLVRTWKGRRHTVTVTIDGFEYQGEMYKSLSKIANTITGSRWNGHVFFGFKK